MKKILIAVPTFENIDPECFKSIYGLRPPKEEEIVVQFDYIKGYDCARARNLIAKEAIDYKFDYVLMVDSDIVLPAKTLAALYDTGKDVVVGWYKRKFTKTGQTEIFKITGEKDFVDANNMNESEFQPHQVFEIKGCGMGCAIIKVDIFHQVGQSKWFEYIEYPNGALLSEDTCFCAKLNHLKIPIYCHSDIKCGHINKFIV